LTEKNKGITRARKDDRRREAEVRQGAHDQLTTEAKIAKLDAGGFRALKQRRRLLEHLDAMAKAQKEPEP
jgi:hypothetical protein